MRLGLSLNEVYSGKNMVKDEGLSTALGSFSSCSCWKEFCQGNLGKELGVMSPAVEFGQLGFTCLPGSVQQRGRSK